MSHDLDQTDGRVSLVLARESAWHQLGTVLEDSFTAEDAMEQGLLGGWDVRKTPMTTEVDGQSLVVPDRSAVVRNNPVHHDQLDVLGVVGNKYVPIQNEEHAEFLNALVDESGAIFDTAGAIDGGRKVFITMKMPGSIKVGGVDPVDMYLAAVNSHDGSTAFTLMVTPIRVVCQNTLNLAFSESRASFRVRHTSGVRHGVVASARGALDLSFTYLEGFQEEADKLINTSITQSRFEEIVEKEFGAGEDSPQATQTRRGNQVEMMEQIFADSITSKNAAGTAWAGLNAVTEWYDHFSPARGDEETNRALNAVFYGGPKNRALELFKQEAGI